MTYRVFFLLLTVLLARTASPGAEALVTWKNAKLEDDGILEPVIEQIAGVNIEASASSFHASLKAAKDGTRKIDGNSVVYFLDDRQDHTGTAC